MQSAAQVPPLASHITETLWRSGRIHPATPLGSGDYVWLQHGELHWITIQNPGLWHVLFSLGAFPTIRPFPDDPRCECGTITPSLTHWFPVSTKANIDSCWLHRSIIYIAWLILQWVRAWLLEYAFPLVLTGYTVAPSSFLPSQNYRWGKFQENSLHI